MQKENSEYILEQLNQLEQKTNIQPNSLYDLFAVSEVFSKYEQSNANTLNPVIPPKDLNKIEINNQSSSEENSEKKVKRRVSDQIKNNKVIDSNSKDDNQQCSHDQEFKSILSNHEKKKKNEDSVIPYNTRSSKIVRIDDLSIDRQCKSIKYNDIKSTPYKSKESLQNQSEFDEKELLFNILKKIPDNDAIDELINEEQDDKMLDCILRQKSESQLQQLLTQSDSQIVKNHLKQKLENKLLDNLLIKMTKSQQKQAIEKANIEPLRDDFQELEKAIISDTEAFELFENEQQKRNKLLNELLQFDKSETEIQHPLSQNDRCILNDLQKLARKNIYLIEDQN